MRSLVSVVSVISLAFLLLAPAVTAAGEEEEGNIGSWVEAVNSDPEDALTWAGLGLNLGKDQTVEVFTTKGGKGGKKRFGKIQVLVQGLNLDPLHTESWANLASAMEVAQISPEEKVKIDGEEYDALSVLKRAIEMDDGVAELWISFGAVLQREDDRKIRQLAFDAKKPSATETDLEGVTYTAVKCFINAIGLKPKEGRAWINLAMSIPDEDKGISSHSTLYNALDDLGSDLAVTHGVEGEFSRVDLLTTGLWLAPEEVTGWRALAHALTETPRETIKFLPRSSAGVGKKKEMNAVNCFEKALSLDPSDGNTWFSLSNALQAKARAEKRGGQTAVVEGKKYTETECGIRAMTLPSLEHRRKSWLNLGLSLQDLEDDLNIEGKDYTKQDCYRKALSESSIPDHVKDADKSEWEAGEGELSPLEESEAWTLLSTTLALDVDTHETEGKYSELKKRRKSKKKGGDTVTLDGKKFRARDCYAEALGINPDNCNAWTNLGASMKRKKLGNDGKETVTSEKVFIGGKLLAASGTGDKSKKKAFTETDAYVEGIKCSEGKDSKAWANLAINMDAMQTVGPIPGFPVPLEEGTDGKMTRTMCLVKAIEAETATVIETEQDKEAKPPRKEKMNKLWKPKRNIDLSNLWMSLAQAIEPTTTVTVFDDLTAGDGTTADERLLKKRDKKAYDELIKAKKAKKKSKKKRRELEGQEYNKIDAFAMSARYNPDQSAPFLSIAIMMRPEDAEGEDDESGEAGIIINGKTYDRLACVKHAIEVDPKEERAWAILYMMMDPKQSRGGGGKPLDRVTIKGKTYDLLAVRKKAGKLAAQIDLQAKQRQQSQQQQSGDEDL